MLQISDTGVQCTNTAFRNRKADWELRLISCRTPAKIHRNGLQPRASVNQCQSTRKHRQQKPDQTMGGSDASPTKNANAASLARKSPRDTVATPLPQEKQPQKKKKKKSSQLPLGLTFPRKNKFSILDISRVAKKKKPLNINMYITGNRHFSSGFYCSYLFVKQGEKFQGRSDQVVLYSSS